MSPHPAMTAAAHQASGSPVALVLIIAVLVILGAAGLWLINRRQRRG